jgi:amino acid permease
MSAKAIDEISVGRPWVRVLLVTVLVAISAFILGPIIWPAAEGNPSPTATQIPFLLFLSLVQATVLGLGVSFLAFGLSVMRRISPDSKVRAWAMYLSIAYLMVSWWPHINMHVHNGPENLQGLIFIDYLFHLPSMIAALVLAYCFFSLFREKGEKRKGAR